MLRAILCLVVFVACGRNMQAEETKGVEVPYRLTMTKHVMIRVKINGIGPFNLICDTGAPAVFITQAVARKSGVKMDDKGWAILDSFVLEGGLDVPKARARVEDLFQLEGMNSMGFAGVELHGVIGYNVLAQYRITYDFTRDKLRWEPIAGFDPPPIEATRQGGGQGGLEIIGSLMKVFAAMMGVKVNFTRQPRGFAGFLTDEREDGVFVRTVLPGSPAEQAGLKAGDRLLLVGSRDIDRERDVARALQNAAVGDRVRVRVRRGQESHDITLTLGKGL